MMTHPHTTRQSSEAGSTMIVVMVILVALLSAGAVSLSTQTANMRASSYVKTSRVGLYCAEAGLAAARPTIGANYAAWTALLDEDPDNDPEWYPIQGDLDGDGEFDYEVTIRDNDDELAPLDNDPTRDNDLRIFVISRCIQDPDNPSDLMELIMYEGGGTIYRNQAGQGSGNTGNIN